MAKHPFGAMKHKAVKFRLHDVAVALLKLADVHEGLWQIQVIFANSATNINLNGHLTPSAIASVVGMQLARVEQAGDELTVDAAVVNPQDNAPRLVTPEGKIFPPSRTH